MKSIAATKRDSTLKMMVQNEDATEIGNLPMALLHQHQILRQQPKRTLRLLHQSNRRNMQPLIPKSSSQCLNLRYQSPVPLVRRCRILVLESTRSRNFDKRRTSVSATSVDEDDEDAIAKAKTLGLNISPLDTRVIDRHVRMILRGDWAKFQKQADSGNRHTRTYLCCSDLSIEATYAMEWTVGTIMRDGDTLLAIYAVEDENAGSPSNSKQPDAERERLYQEGAQAGKAANDTMAQLTKVTTNDGDQIQHKFIPATEAQSLTGSVDARKVGKKELDRLKAIDEVTQTFLRLVRKTTLQVRCMVEVIHCKSPKHLILGAVSQTSY